jgi:vitamin B12 transporter
MRQRQLLAALLVAATPLAQAESETLGEVVVTATRMEQPLQQALAHTTVINQKDILDSQAADVPTLLRQLAGVEIYQAGGIGKQSSVFMRGTNSGHVLVLLDGVRIGSATTGATAIDQLMLEQIERIEVVRGNVSSLYGSDAIGGVIQIFTRRGRGEPRFTALAGIGSERSRKFGLGYGGKTERASFNLQASRNTTSGHSALDPQVTAGANPDKDGYTNTTWSGNWRQALGADHAFILSGFDSRGEVQFDNAWAVTPSEVNISKTRLGKTTLALEDRFTSNWLSQLSRNRGKDELDMLTDGQSISRIKTSSEQWTWQNTVLLDEINTLLLLSESTRQRVDSDTAYTQTERTVDSYLFSYVSRTATQQLQLNKRQDRYSDFGQADTWLLAYGLQLDPQWRLGYSSGTAFKAPTFNDMYAPALWGGNPSLLPERARNREWGLHFKSEKTQLELAYFNNQILDLIAADSFWVMQNIAQARIRGTELAIQTQEGVTRWHLNYTVQNPRNELTGALLPKRARKFGNFGFMQQKAEWNWGLDWQYSGLREESNGTPLPSYTFVNLVTRYSMGQHADLSLRVDNLLNKKRVQAYGYTPTGRGIFVTFNYH